MSTDNPDITASDIISDVENKLDDPGIDTTVYLPWVSYGYQKTFNALLKCGQRVKEGLFEDSATISLTLDTLEITITTQIPRFGGLVKLEVKYGASGDDWNTAANLGSSSHWRNLQNVSTSYRSKTQPLYLQSGTKLMVIPVPPETGAQAYVRYIKRPYQLTSGTDVIDIPYRYLTPLNNYVQAKALQRANEDYTASAQIENRFLQELEEIMEAAVSEFHNENDGSDAVEVSTDDSIYTDPLSF
jgi:hypothetical protein